MYGETDVSALDVGSRTASCHPVLTHIPFFIYVPAKWEAQIGVEELRANTQRVVSNVDVTPTLLDLWGMAGIDPSDGAVPPMDGQSLLSPISEERSVWCFNLPVWSALPTAALGVYSRDRMAYMRSEFDEILYMNSSDWVDKSQWRRWDSPTEADRVWLSEALGAYELLEPYMRKIQTANPTLMEGLSQGPRPAAPWAIWREVLPFWRMPGGYDCISDGVALGLGDRSEYHGGASYEVRTATKKSTDSMGPQDTQEFG